MVDPSRLTKVANNAGKPPTQIANGGHPFMLMFELAPSVASDCLLIRRDIGSEDHFPARVTQTLVQVDGVEVILSSPRSLLQISSCLSSKHRLYFRANHSWAFSAHKSNLHVLYELGQAWT